MRILALTAAFVATLLVSEITVRLVGAGLDFSSRQEERRAFLQRIPMRELREPVSKEGSAGGRSSGPDFVLHPYFGYTYRPSFEGTDARGFYSGGGTLPYRAAPDELVVGIFGGSVAMQVADARARLVESLLPGAHAAGWARVTLRSFAVGGWRQPQHFNALVRFLDEIDVAIVVDGFNEVIHLGDWHLARQPAEYPWSDVYATLARQPTTEEMLQRAELVRLHVQAARMTNALDLPVLRSSALAQLAWRVWAARYEGRTTEIRGELAGGEPSALGSQVDPATLAVRRDEYIHLWHELILFSDAIARLRGKAFFHFVQPNQYARGSKPLSPEEREHFTLQTAWFDEVTPRYAVVERVTAQLRGEGVDSTFLGNLFVTSPETLYVDDCCHLNERGMRQLAAAVARHVADSGRLAMRRVNVRHDGGA